MEGVFLYIFTSLYFSYRLTLRLTYIICIYIYTFAASISDLLNWNTAWTLLVRSITFLFTHNHFMDLPSPRHLSSHSVLPVSESVLPRASEWPFRRATGNMLPSVTAGPFPPGNSSLYPLFFPPDILKLTPEALQRLTDFLTHSQLQQHYCSSHLTEHQSKFQMH